MEQYISKFILLTEIERLEKINQEYKKTWKWKFKWFYRTIIGRLEVLEGLKAFINTHEIKEVNWEEEFNKYCENYIFDDECEVYTAKHFFELGIKTLKRE